VEVKILMGNLFELEKKILKSNSPDEIDKITENMTQQQLRDMIKLLIDRLTPQNIKINKMINENYKKYPDCEHRKEIEVMGVKCKSGFCDIDDLECDSSNGSCRNK